MQDILVEGLARAGNSGAHVNERKDADEVKEIVAKIFQQFPPK
jgi:hypothetical protein